MTTFTDGIGAVERSLGTGTAAARVQTIARSYPTDPNDLWDACTSPGRLQRWFAPVTGELRLGGRYQVEGNAGGTVETCDPPRSFAVTWEFGDEAGRVTVTLTPVAEGGTRLELQHVAHVDDERWTRYGPGATGIGWDLTLLGLALHVAGTPRPADDDPDLVPFVIAAARHWQAAAEGAGDPPAAAARAADNCIAFYTGVPS